MAITLLVREAIRSQFSLLCTYERGERAGMLREVVVLALLRYAPSGGKTRPRPNPVEVGWLLYDPTAYHHTAPFATYDVREVHWEGARAVPRVSYPTSINDFAPPGLALKALQAWSGVGRRPPAGFVIMWDILSNSPLPRGYGEEAVPLSPTR